MKALPILVMAQLAAIFPLFLWLVPVRVIKGGFFRFNLGMATTLLGISTMLGMVNGIDGPAGWWVLALATVSLAILGMTWHRPAMARNLLLPPLLGWGLLLWQVSLAGQLPAIHWEHWVAMSLGGFGLASVMFAMVLGHWYLNVTELPIQYLGRGISLAFGALTVHLVWVMAILSTKTIILNFRAKPAYRLLMTTDGFFLWIGLILGLIAPLVIDWLAWRTARLGATQSATGLLYVSLILVTIGILILDSYILQMGLPV